MADETPRQIIFATQKDIVENQRPEFLHTTQTKWQLTEHGNKNRPQMSEPLWLKGFEIPEILQMARGEKFMYYDSGPQVEKKYFATLTAIEFLKQSDDWLCDGTFSTSPNGFYQLYTIHTSVQGVDVFWSDLPSIFDIFLKIILTTRARNNDLRMCLQGTNYCAAVILFFRLQSVLSRLKLHFLFDLSNERFDRDCFVWDCFVWDYLAI